MRTEQIAFIGGGNMAEAILGGLLAGGVSTPQRLRVADIAPERRAWLAETYAVNVTDDAAEAVRDAAVVILAVKPQQAAEVLGTVAPALSPAQLMVSICAGLSTTTLESWVPARVARVMPNLPALVGKGVSAICGGSRATAADLDLVAELFAAVGLVVRLPESQMNEVTALSGSGPGYVFAFIEALATTGVKMGLPEDAAWAMARETVRGAAELAAHTGEHPADLRRKVCSPGGTTLAGLAAMESAGFSAAVAAGMQAARQRAAELAGAS